jgi:hypothetical protein
MSQIRLEKFNRSQKQKFVFFEDNGLILCAAV